MTLSSDIIEQIVQNVLREIHSREPRPVTAAPAVSSAVPATAAAAPNSTASVSASTAAAPLAIHSQVITEQILTAAQAADRVVTLPAAAVITPSGRDYIRRHRVRLASSVAAGQTSAAATVSAVRGILLNVGPPSSFSTAAAAAGWQAEQALTEAEAARLAAGLATQHRVACCGGEPAVVACLLNREVSLRAAVVTRQTRLSSLWNCMNPQIVCFDPAGWSFVDVLRLLRSWTAVPAAPAGWQELNAGGVR